jgi:neutral ceramidase
MTATGPVDTSGHLGIAFLTGSEEGRGPLYDVTQTPLEGITSPFDDPVQGDKIGIPDGAPTAVPIAVVRIGDGALATIPGEATKETGVRIRAAVLDAVKPAGITHVVIDGLANDYIQYVATPEEFQTQSYEAASTIFGKNEATFFQERLAELGRALAEGKPAPDPYPFDPSFGVHPDGAPYPPGADHGNITTEPADSVARGATISMAWSGGPSGHDRPVDRAFIRAERLVGRRWRIDDTDLGLDMLWRVDDQGHHTVEWRPARTLPAGTFRLHVTAARYELISRTFTVTP